MADVIEESPVHSLPNEILQSIFLLASPPSFEIQPNATLSELNLSPVHFSHVCRRWFQASTQYPRLWNQIGVILDGKPKHIIQFNRTRAELRNPGDGSSDCGAVLSGLSRVYFTRLFLQNSGQSLLDVTVLPSPSFPVNLSLYDTTCIEILHNNMSRVHTFVCDSFYLPLLTFTNPAPLLRSVHLTGPGMHGSKMMTHTSFLLLAPLLDEITLEFSPRRISAPWPQIHHVSLLEGSIPDLAFLAITAVSLENLTMTGLSALEPSDLFFPQLKNLRFVAHDEADNIDLLFRHVDCSALATLSIELDPWSAIEEKTMYLPELDPHHWHQAFQERMHSCNDLKSLAFKNCHLDDMALLALLRSCPRDLESLDVWEDAPFTPAFVLAMGIGDDLSEPILPNLKKITLSGPFAAGADDACMELGKSRALGKVEWSMRPRDNKTVVLERT